MQKETLLKELWNEACLSAGIPAISTDTCARIFAVIYVHGNNEAFVFNKSFLADVEYIKNRFHIHGSESPNTSFSILLKKYVGELEAYIEAHKDEKPSDGGVLFKSHVPKWAVDLFKNRYGIKIIN